MLSRNFIICPELCQDIIKQSNRSNNKLWPAVFRNSKEVRKKYKGKSNLNFIAQNTTDLFKFWSSSPRTAFLELKDTHIGRIACECNFLPNCMRMQLCMQFLKKCNCANMGVFQLVWTSGMPSQEMKTPTKLMNCILFDEVKIGFSFVFFRTSFVFLKTVCHSLLLLQLL